MVGYFEAACGERVRGLVCPVCLFVAWFVGFATTASSNKQDVLHKYFTLFEITVQIKQPYQTSCHSIVIASL
jgi:hypothetical protein